MPRLIDADALKEYILRSVPNWSEDREIVLDCIANSPTIEERKMGKWIDETFKPWGLVYHPYKCDQCGEHSESDSDYCPNCGADMKGENDGK